MITPVLFSNTGLLSAPNKVKTCNAYNKPVQFRGINSGDIFVREAASTFSKKEFNAVVNSIFTKMQQQLKAFTPEQLESAIRTVLKEVPNTNEQEVLTVMQKLTQWANYRCLDTIEKHLLDLKVGEIENSTLLNRSFEYLQYSKKLIAINKNSNKVASFVTESDLDTIISKKPEADIFINLEGFDAGVNIFSDDRKLPEYTTNTLRKVKELLRKAPNKNFNDALYEVLNQRILNTMHSNGYEVNTIQNNKPATRKNILMQMRPYAPASPKDIAKALEKVAKYFTKDNTSKYPELLKNTADYFDNRLNIFSKQRIVEDLQAIDIKINQLLKEKHLPKNKVYYVISNEEDPNTNKSYGLITYMFARNNNIPPENIKHIDTMLELNFEKQNTTYIILDDFVGSGDSMSNVANYRFDRYKLNKDSHVLFCPVTATEEGLDFLDATIEIGSRENRDFIVTLKENIQKNINDKKNVDLENYFTFDQIGKEAYGNGGYKGEGNSISGCTIFPYMTPDNNSDLASFLSSLFLPNQNAIKRLHQDFFKVF